jgi:hypothetical protein
MGMNRRDVELLLRLASEGHIAAQANVVELGAQQLSRSLLESKDVVSKLGELLGAKGEPPLLAEGPSPSVADGSLDPNAPFSRGLWNWLGFTYAAIDIDGSPGSIPLDLNYDEVPKAQVGRFDLVTNFGTTEHVANQLNAFKIVHDLTAVGGVMIHNLPGQGFFNHGLVNYNPKYFWKLAASNDYGWLYFDYRPAHVPERMPENIAEEIARFNPELAGNLPVYEVPEAAVVVALKKRRSAPYVAAIDVSVGAMTDNRDLLRRYPTIFKAR